MELSGIGQNAPTADRRQEVGKQIADIIQVSGIEIFRQAVRQVACNRVKIEDERERRDEARREALKENGVLYRDGAIPDRPEGDWYFHQEILGGYIELPSKVKLPPTAPKRPDPPVCLRDRNPRKDWDDTDKKAIDRFHADEAKYNKRIQAFWRKWHQAILPLFERVKKRGFPNDDDGDYRYGFDLCCWLPRELHYDNDPPHERLLPVPRRALMDAEKMTILAAVYDAHWRGAEKIAPWGVSEDGEEPDPWPSDAERDERRAALGYFILFREAENLDAADLPIVRSWLEEWKLPFQPSILASDTPNASAQAISEPPPPPPPPPPADTTLVFAPDGDGYFIRGFGAEGHFKSSVGLRRLEMLLHNAGKPVLMTSLVSEGKSPRSVATLDEVMDTPEDGETGFQGEIQQNVLDDDTLKDIQKELMRFDRDMEKADSDSDTAAVDRLRSEKDELLKHLKKDLRFGGKRSRGTPSETDKLRGAIGSSLSEAYKKLRAGNPEPLNMLADHLHGAIHATGPTYLYSPRPPVQWSFDRKP